MRYSYNMPILTSANPSPVSRCAVAPQGAPATHVRRSRQPANKASPVTTSIARPISHQQCDTRQPARRSTAPATQVGNPVVSKRRAVTNGLSRTKQVSRDLFPSFMRSVSGIPFPLIAALIACVLSLYLIITSSALITDAKREHSRLYSDVVALSVEEGKLETDLQSKNDLRIIEQIAVNELGMVKKGLVSRKFVSIGTETLIESFEEDREAPFISVLLSAISSFQE